MTLDVTLRFRISLASEMRFLLGRSQRRGLRGILGALHGLHASMQASLRLSMGLVACLVSVFRQCAHAGFVNPAGTCVVSCVSFRIDYTTFIQVSIMPMSYIYIQGGARRYLVVQALLYQ